MDEMGGNKNLSFDSKVIHDAVGPLTDLASPLFQDERGAGSRSGVRSVDNEGGDGRNRISIVRFGFVLAVLAVQRDEKFCALLWGNIGM
jgi:hypothetical protein